MVMKEELSLSQEQRERGFMGKRIYQKSYIIKLRYVG